MTAFLGLLSRELAALRNAGHLPPLHVRGGHGLRRSRAMACRSGCSSAMATPRRELQLERGDLVFAHTDGLIEARREGEMYGTERLPSSWRGCAGSHAPQELVRAVHEEVTGWADGISDDAVALALRRSA